MKMQIIRGTARTILEYVNPVLLSTVFAQHGVGVELPDTGASDRIVTAGQMPDFPFVPWEKGLGAAVDIGTTTVALYLYDLENGRLLDTGSERNPQAVFGADVISRMEKAMAGEADALAVSIRNLSLIHI